MARGVDRSGWYHRVWGLVLLAVILAITPSSDCVAQAEKAEDTSTQDDLPLFAEMELPSFEELNTGKALDWILLKSGRVLIVQPLYPRPGVLAWLDEEIKKLVNQRPTREDLQVEWRRRREELNSLQVTLPDPDLVSPEFLLETRLIDKVLYFEDLLLLKVEKLKEEGRWGEAFDLLSRSIERDVTRLNFDAVEGRKISTLEDFFKSKSTWPGIQDAYVRLMLDEAKSISASKRFEEALSRLDELRVVKSDAPLLETTTADVSRAAINDSVAREDFIQARFFLNRLKGMYPRNSVVTDEAGRLIAQATKLMGEGLSQYSSGHPEQGYVTMTKAIRIWPDTPGLSSAFRRVSTRYQILRAGVFGVPTEKSVLPYPSLETRRIDDLTREPFFRPHSFQNQAVLFDSAYLEDWVPTDLGREYLLVLKTDRQPYETYSTLDAQELSRAMRPLFEQGSSGYNERLSSFIRHIEPLDSQRLRISLAAIPVAPEAVFASFLMAARNESEVEVATVSASDEVVRLDYSSRKVNTQRFKYAGEFGGAARYIRSKAEPADTLDFHVAEIQEQLVTSPLEATDMMKRGDLDYIPDAPPFLVEQFREDGKFFVQKWAVPKTTVLQFHLESSYFKRSVMRRVLQYSINRERLLGELLEVGNYQRYGRLVSGPGFTASSSYNKLVELAPYSPATSLALLLTSQNPNDKPLPPLKFLVPNEPTAIKMATQIAEGWRRLGIGVELLRDDGKQSGPVAYDVVYRELRMYEPLTELWPMLTMKSDAEIEDLINFPAWLRVKLLSLEKAPDRVTAEKLAREIHQDLAREVFLIPLWEVDQYAVFGNHVQGFHLTPLTPYHQVERWSLRPRVLSVTP